MQPFYEGRDIERPNSCRVEEPTFGTSIGSCLRSLASVCHEALFEKMDADFRVLVPCSALPNQTDMKENGPFAR